jgi:hypothetical protein
MEINLELLIDYISKLGSPVTININIDDHTESSLIFQKGKHKDNGSTRVFFSYQDLMDILLANDIVGENGKIKLELNNIKEMPVDKGGAQITKSEINIEKFTYETLAKYIIQMLGASKGKIFFPEIKHLAKHNTYFLF